MKKCLKCGTIADNGEYCSKCGCVLADAATSGAISKIKNSIGKETIGSSRLKGSIGSAKKPAFELECVIRHRPTTKLNNSFTRAPRLMQGVETSVVTIEHPPQAGGVPQINWLNVLITPLISVALMLILIFAMGISAVMLIMSGVMSVVSAAVAILNYQKQKKQHEEASQNIEQKYHQYLDSISVKVQEAHKQQLQIMIAANPAPVECVSVVSERKRSLWERRPTDSDYLCARIGRGTIPAAISADYRKANIVLEENKLEDEAYDLAVNSKTLDDAPILCNFMQGKQTGIVGVRADGLRLMRNVITELATSHSYDELKIILFVPKDERAEWDWVRWLPHCSDNQQIKRYIYTSFEEAESELEEIEEELSHRKTENEDLHGAGPAGMLPHYLFIITAFPWVEKLPIRKYILSNADLGCSAIFLYNSLSSLPKECNQIIEVGGGHGQIYDRTSISNKILFSIDEFPLGTAESFAREMAPIHTDTEQAISSIPTSISFLEGYKVTSPDQLGISERWKNAKTYRTLSVPIAATAGGDIFEFDIHEKYHGVNGIVAGMPGSGKTEMVQSWLLSLAVNYPPQDVSFILIDFKGTGMIAPFRGLPHLAGAISNLDTNIDRNLIAIRSEVHRREAIIDKYSNKSIKNVNDLNKSFANGLVDEKLPILLIVIDEFAEFKKNFPDFGAEIDSLTSKGRALGIFVILMTQKPTGVVSVKSEDNIKFRWCLRVANYGASREVLGKPDAAKINNPGRAFVKVGEDDVYEEVQSFWSGAPYSPEKNNADMAFSPISKVELNGKRIPCECREERMRLAVYETEIDVVTRYLANYCKLHGIKDAEKVWTDRLPERLALQDILHKGFNGEVWPEAERTAPIIGLIDDPANQKQYPLELNFSKLGHTVVYGAPVTGKTTLLQTLVMSMALSRKPDEVSIYVIDFGGWNMSVLRDLPHVGGIANDNEPERLKKLILLLSDVLQERKEKFSQIGVGNIAAYRDATKERIPDVCLIIDNFGALIKAYQDLDAFFMTLTSSGANYGVYLIATATATNAIPIKISQNIKNALALQLIEKNDYTYTVGKVNSVLPAIMGRGFTKGNPPLEFQTALPAVGEDDKAISDSIRKLSKDMRTIWAGALPDIIPEMPENIAYGSIKTKAVALGLSKDKVQPVIYDYTRQHYLLISGTEQSGKSNLLQVVTRQLKEKLGGKLFVFNIKGSGLSRLMDAGDAYYTSAVDVDTFMEEIRPELQRRHSEKQAGTASGFEPIILAIDDYTTFFQAISNETAQRLLAIAKIGKGLDLYLVVSGDAYELSAFSSKGEPLTIALTKAKQVVMLGGCMNDHASIPVTASYSQKNVPLHEHEGLLISNSCYTAFKPIEIRGGEE